MSHSNTSAYYPEELAIANKRIEKLTNQLDQTLTQLEAAQAESRRGWGRATSLESQLAIVVEQREESQDHLAAAQAANRTKTESLVHLIDALKSSGFIVRQQDLEARIISDTFALDAAIAVALTKDSDSILMGINDAVTAATKPLVDALEQCESALAAFLPHHPAGQLARTVLEQRK